MLSLAYTRKHGMKNEKWTLKEKTIQYRTLLKLHARDKNIQTSNAAKLRRKVSRNLKDLKEDVKEYRKILNHVAYGDKRLMRLAIQDAKDFQILLNDAEPEEAYKTIFQDFNLKRKQLDKLIYEKSKLEKRLCVARSEVENLLVKYKDRNKLTEDEEKFQSRQQGLLSYIQAALAKQHAGIAIRNTYNDILVILKKDSMYFDGVLNALRSDQREQSKIIYRTTMMGQLATEDLDDIRLKYQKMADEVWINMKERERSLEVMRRRCNDIWEYAKSLVRTESDPNLLKKKSDDNLAEDVQLQREIKRLEDIFNTMKESLLIRSYEELFLRLEGQMNQKIKLSRIYKNCLQERDRLLNKKNHAELIEKNLEHTMVSGTTKYQSNKKTMVQKIEEEKLRTEKQNRLIQSQGKLLMDIRSALIHQSLILMCVQPLKGKSDVNVYRHSHEPAVCDGSIEPDALTLLSNVIKKATLLVQQTSYPLSDDKLEKAKDMYQEYVAEYQSNLKFGREVEEEQGMMFEHEVIDSAVPTRAEIKMKSKHIVESYARKE